MGCWSILWCRRILAKMEVSRWYSSNLWMIPILQNGLFSPPFYVPLSGRGKQLATWQNHVSTWLICGRHRVLWQQILWPVPHGSKGTCRGHPFSCCFLKQVILVSRSVASKRLEYNLAGIFCVSLSLSINLQSIESRDLLTCRPLHTRSAASNSGVQASKTG